MRLWPRRGVSQRLAVEQEEARRAIEQSKAAGRRVDAKQGEVDRMSGVLTFYSTRNGFADAFEAMMDERGRGRAGSG
jgi:hypothetical protein